MGILPANIQVDSQTLTTQFMPHAPDEIPVGKLRNIGPASTRTLADIDVHTAGDVRTLGIPLVLHILRSKGIMVSMNLAYALHAGLLGVHWLELDPETKETIRKECTDD